MDDGCSDGNGVLKAEVTIDKGKMLEIFKQLKGRKLIPDTGKRGFSCISRQISFKRIGAALTRQTEKKTFHCGLPSWLRATKLYLTDLSLPTCSLAPDIAIEHCGGGMLRGSEVNTCCSVVECGWCSDCPVQCIKGLGWSLSGADWARTVELTVTMQCIYCQVHAGCWEWGGACRDACKC